MRNGDYPPSRFQAQSDAVNLICGAKTQSNPENTVGVLTMGGKGVRVLVTPTADLGKILSSMHGVEVEGTSVITSAVQVAQLALKHRQNKNQRQRIVLFAGSPVSADADTLVRIGKKLKKNNVALDIVSFGDEDDSKSSKLAALLEAVNSNDNSHLVHVPPGPAVLSDVIISSPIFTGDGEGGSGFAAAAAAGAAAAATAAGGAPDGYDFGVDPNLDPELALALRVSMEEERARQEAAARRAAEESTGKAPQEGQVSGTGDLEGEARAFAEAAMFESTEDMGEGAAASDGAAAAAVADKGPVPMDDESMLLQQALAMSMSEAQQAGTSGGATSAMADSAMADAGGQDDELALGNGAPVNLQADASMSDVLTDSSFMNSVLASVPARSGPQ
eukprot:jgi/Mesen1/10448/ME000082S09953